MLAPAIHHNFFSFFWFLLKRKCSFRYERASNNEKHVAFCFPLFRKRMFYAELSISLPGLLEHRATIPGLGVPHKPPSQQRPAAGDPPHCAAALADDREAARSSEGDKTKPKAQHLAPHSTHAAPRHAAARALIIARTLW